MHGQKNIKNSFFGIKFCLHVLLSVLLFSWNILYLVLRKFQYKICVNLVSFSKSWSFFLSVGIFRICNDRCN